MSYSGVVAIVVVGFLSINVSAISQSMAQGERSQVLTISGHPITCDYPNGTAVQWIADFQLRDVGNTGPFGIRFNPNVLAQMPDRIKLFWLGHECGHAHLPTSIEEDADCYSARTGVQQGWFDESDFAALEASFQTNPGDQTHPPGPVRSAHIRDCMKSIDVEPIISHKYTFRSGQPASALPQLSSPDVVSSTTEALLPPEMSEIRQATSPSSQHLSVGTFTTGVNFKPFDQALPLLAEGMKDGFSFERLNKGEIAVVTTGIEANGRKETCYGEDGFTSCSFFLFRSTVGPEARAEYLILQPKMRALLPTWNCIDKPRHGNILLSTECDNNGMHAVLEITTAHESGIDLELSWPGPPQQ